MTVKIYGVPCSRCGNIVLDIRVDNMIPSRKYLCSYCLVEVAKENLKVEKMTLAEGRGMEGNQFVRKMMVGFNRVPSTLFERGQYYTPRKEVE